MRAMKKWAVVVAALLLLPAVPMTVSAAEQTVRVAFTNDVHGHIMAGGSDLGLAVFSAKAKELQTDMILDAGDLYHGLAVATITKGESVADAVKAAGFDAMTVGNHDWNYGQAQLKVLQERSGVPVLCSNVLRTADGQPFFETSTLIKDIGGVKVGVFGVIDPLIYDSTAYAIMEGLVYDDQIAYAKAEVAALKEQGCDIVICLTHTTDRTTIANNVPGVDVVISGHEHVLSSETINGVQVVQTGTAIQNFCYMDISFDPATDKVTGVSVTAIPASELAGVQPDPTVQAALDDVNARLDPLLKTVIGTTPVDLETLKAVVRSGETNMARVVTDAYRYTTGAEISFENSGGIRDAAIKAGGITYGDVATLCPFGNFLVTKRISGADLISIVNRSYDIFWSAQEATLRDDSTLWPDNDGSGLHVSGLTYCYDRTLDSGERVWNIRVNGRDIDPERMYTVAMSNYIADLADYPEIVAAATTGMFYTCEESIRNFIMDKGVTDSINDSLRMEEKSKPIGEDPDDIETPQTGAPDAAGQAALIAVAVLAAALAAKKRGGVYSR